MGSFGVTFIRGSNFGASGRPPAGGGKRPLRPTLGAYYFQGISEGAVPIIGSICAMAVIQAGPKALVDGAITGLGAVVFFQNDGGHGREADGGLDDGVKEHSPLPSGDSEAKSTPRLSTTEGADDAASEAVIVCPTAYGRAANS